MYGTDGGNMILMDLSQLVVAAFMAQIGHSNIDINEDLIRHLILDTIRSNKKKFKDYGELVICCDSGNLWRKSYFAYYKARRSLDKKASTVNWADLYSSLATIINELKESFPYRVVKVDGGEGDDVIACLVKHLKTDDEDIFNFEKTLIISGDHDFCQLEITNPDIVRWDPIHKRYLREREPVLFLKEHIIRGDVGDGIPNIMSSDDCLIKRERQGVITKGRLNSFMKSIPSEYEYNWRRNDTLINFDNIPRPIYDNVVKEYNAQGGKDRSKLMNYFIKHRLKKLMSSMADF